MNRFDRVVSIWMLFQSKRVITAQEIAQRFGVSVRTVYRDIRTLETAGLPILSEAGVGYSLDRGYKLPPVVFDREEALALFMAEKFMGQSSDRVTKEAYFRALTKIRAVLNEHEKSMLDGLDKRVRVHHSRASDEVSDPWLLEVQHAIAHSRILDIDYFTPSRQTSETRPVEPLGLYFYSQHWHLIAWCQVRNNYRDFRLDRIQRLVNTGQWFDQRERGDLDTYFKESHRQAPLTKVDVSFDKEVAAFTHNQRHWYGFIREFESASGEVGMSFLTPSLEYFGRWIMSYTNSVKVIAPTELNDMMRRFLNEMKEALDSQ